MAKVGQNRANWLATQTKWENAAEKQQKVQERYKRVGNPYFQYFWIFLTSDIRGRSFLWADSSCSPKGGMVP